MLEIFSAHALFHARPSATLQTLRDTSPRKRPPRQHEKDFPSTNRAFQDTGGATMSHLFRPSLIILAQAVSVTLLLAGCDDLMKQMPAGTGQMIQSGMSVGGAILNRPKFSEADEEKMAQENAKKYEQAHQMWDDPLLDAYLGDIVQRLAAVAHPRPFTYSIRVVKDASINAFTFGGGILYVNAGLLARMDNEGQLAMVLGHEIAHVTESHVVRGIESNYNTQLLGQLAGQAAAASGKIPLTPAVFNLTYEYSMKAALSGHGRSSESEADDVGLDYMVKAGYDPREAPHTFEQLLKEYGDQTALQNFFYGDHPTNKARIEKLTELTKYKKRDKAKAIAAFEQYLKVAPSAPDAGRIKKSIEDLKRS